MSRRFAILDVFTDRPLAGNPLAVVLDGSGLDDARMQAIAAEFNLSETVFVLPAENSHHSAAIRIFTPARELPFAGHPTIGTAVVLALETAHENPANHEMVLMLEEKVGPVRCGVTVKTEAGGHAIFDLPRMPTAAADPGNRETVALALGLLPAEIGFENHRPTGFDAGVPYGFVPVRNLDAIERARPHPQHFAKTFGEVTGAFVYTRDRVGPVAAFHARMFAPGLGIAEDPATGSAVAAFAGVVARFDQPPGGGHHYLVEQGFEMGRPSLIGLEIDMDDGAVVAARISGDAVVVAEGALAV